MTNDVFTIRRSFSLQEAVVLLDVYLQARQKRIPLMKATKEASEWLRALAISNGEMIDKSFRSPEGLRNRLRSIASIYEGPKSRSAPSTKVFLEVVTLYRSNNRKYNDLLSAAARVRPAYVQENACCKKSEERQAPFVDEKNHDTINEFYQWLSAHTSPSPASQIAKSFVSINAMLIQANLLPGPLCTITSVSQLEAAKAKVNGAFGSKKNRHFAFKLLSAYASYLREKEDMAKEKITAISPNTQENWIKFDGENVLLFERTVPAYCSVAGREITAKTWARILVAIVERELADSNPRVQDLFNKPLLSKRSNRPFFMSSKLEGLNCAQLTNGSWINLNYNIPSLIELILTFCLFCGYSNSQLLMYGEPKNAVSKSKDDRTTTNQNRSGLDMQKVIEYLLSRGLLGATVQEVITAVSPSAAVSSTRKALDESMSVICMPHGRYVHVNSFVDLDEAEEALLRIFKTHFASFGGYTNSTLLHGAAALDMSMFLNDNDCDDADSVFAIARFLFEKKVAAGKPFKFAAPHIFESEPNFPRSLKGLMINLARRNGGVLSTEDAKDYLQKTMLSYGGIGQILQVYSDNTFLMYDESNYLLTEKMGIDDAWVVEMHDRLDNLFRLADVAYVIPRDISSAWFETLPVLPMGMHWTMLLLQEVIKKYPAIGFNAIKSELDQPYNTIAAAFVPRESPVQTFADVVSLYLQEHHQLPQKMTCEDLRIKLREAGMLEGNELIYSLYRALDDYRFAWTDENKTVLVRGS